MFVAMAAGCTGAAAPAPTPKELRIPKRVKAIYNEQTNRLEQLMYDSNLNGTLDAWGHMDATRVLWVEIDQDEDGVIERWEYYGPDQKLVKIGYSTTNDGKVNAWAYRDSDGLLSRLEFGSVEKTKQGSPDNIKISRTEFYQQGKLVRAEEDTNSDGRVDKWETFVDAALASMAYDSRFRGAPDRRLVYDPDGRLERIEADPDGDGTFAPLPLKR
jgi:hypothetical protein